MKIWKIEKQKYSTILIEPNFCRCLEDTYMCICLLFCRFYYMSRRYVSEKYIRMSNRRVCFSYEEIIHATFEWPCNRRDGTRARARATEMRRYITLLQTLSRRRVITRGFLNQMRLSQRHEHPSSRRDGANAILDCFSISKIGWERFLPKTL